MHIHAQAQIYLEEKKLTRGQQDRAPLARHRVAIRRSYARIHTHTQIRIYGYISAKRNFTLACAAQLTSAAQPQRIAPLATHSRVLHNAGRHSRGTESRFSLTHVYDSLLHTYTRSYVNTDLWIYIWKRKLYTCTCSTTYTCSTMQGANRAAPSHNSLLRTSLDSTRLAALEAEVCVCENETYISDLYVSLHQKRPASEVSKRDWIPRVLLRLKLRCVYMKNRHTSAFCTSLNIKRDLHQRSVNEPGFRASCCT